MPSNNRLTAFRPLLQWLHRIQKVYEKLQSSESKHDVPWACRPLTNESSPEFVCRTVWVAYFPIASGNAANCELLVQTNIYNVRSYRDRVPCSAYTEPSLKGIWEIETKTINNLNTFLRCACAGPLTTERPRQVSPCSQLRRLALNSCIRKQQADDSSRGCSMSGSRLKRALRYVWSTTSHKKRKALLTCVNGAWVIQFEY